MTENILSDGHDFKVAKIAGGFCVCGHDKAAHGKSGKCQGKSTLYTGATKRKQIRCKCREFVNCLESRL